jgi:enoyl-CoA hydratase
MTSGLISIEKSKDKVLILTINRPKALNALNTSLLEELDHTLLGLITNPDSLDKIRLLLIRGAGEKAFVAGADVKEFTELSPESLDRFISLGQRVMKRISDFPCPTVAFVKGYCLGGGFELALSCDMIICSENSRFAFPEVSLGLIPGFGGTQRILRRVGHSTAKHLIFTGKQINAEEAFRIGIVQEILAPESEDETLNQICQKIVSLPPRAMRAAKRSIETAISAFEGSGFEVEKKEFLSVFFSEDAIEGRNAFIENRPPNFKDA